MSKETKKDDDLDFIKKYRDTAIIVFILAVGFYAFIYTGFDFSIKEIADGGSIGDFFGGILNPIFGLLALFALLETIRIQTKELKASSEALTNSSEELKFTKEAAINSSKALEQQSESIKQQNFENTFFNMINLHNEIVKSLTYNGTSYRIVGSDKEKRIESYKVNQDFSSGKVLENALLMLKHDLSNVGFGIANSNKTYLDFFKIYEQSLSKYYRNMYQILKFISRSVIPERKLYANILRAQLSNNELELLFYHCASDIGNEKFLPLLIEFEFLEHLPYRYNIDVESIILYAKRTQELNQEDPKKNYKDYRVFGKNKELKKVVEGFI